MGKVRTVLDHDFTITDNYMIKDRRLSFMDKGLLLTMISLPEGWDFSIKGLAALVPDGRTKIAASLKRLEEYGYLKRKRTYVNGKISDIDYIFSDRPIFEKENIAEKNLESEKLKSENLIQENLNAEDLDSENLIGNKEKNNKERNDKELNQSIRKTDRAEVQKEARKLYEHIIKNNIEYEYMIERANIVEKEYIEQIYELIIDTVCLPVETIKINQTSYPHEVVKSAFLKLKDGHIYYVLEKMKKNTQNIINMRAYLLTTLYNASITDKFYWQARVNHDLYGRKE